jgi:hypothetical protein
LKKGDLLHTHSRSCINRALTAKAQRLHGRLLATRAVLLLVMHLRSHERLFQQRRGFMGRGALGARPSLGLARSFGRVLGRFRLRPARRFSTRRPTLSGAASGLRSRATASRSPRPSVPLPARTHAVRESAPRRGPAVRSDSVSRRARALGRGSLSRRRSTIGKRDDCSSGNHDSRLRCGRKSCRFRACVYLIAYLIIQNALFRYAKNPYRTGEKPCRNLRRRDNLTRTIKAKIAKHAVLTGLCGAL